jgi:uncharacterized phage protein gp47/JayE
MARTPAQISSDIRAKLAITAPNLSAEIGTPERKIIDAVAESISENSVDVVIAQSFWSLDTKVGSELDEFVAFFGFGRLQGKASQGILTFSLSSAATQDIVLLAGTQAYVPGGSATGNLFFVTTTEARIVTGGTTVNVAARCVQVGSVGNVTASQVTAFSVGIGVSSVTNAAAFANGTDTETDEELRARFRATVLRNIAGTDDFYVAMLLQSPFVTRVNVLGPVSKYKEQLSISAGAATSSVTSSKYTYPNGEFISTNLGTSSEIVYQPTTDYTISTAVPPVITIVNGVALPNGTVIDVEHQYVSSSSRNDIVNGISNKVDVIMNGVQAVAVQENTLIVTTTFNNTAGDPLNVTNFYRRNTTTNPAATSRFQRLGSVPVVSFPSTITISASTWDIGIDYYLVDGITTDKGSQREVCGIEWLSTASPALPAGGTAVSFFYSYNRLPELFDEMLRQNKQLTTDVLVRQAEFVYMNVYLVIMYNQGVGVSAVNTQINLALSNFFAQQGFSTWIQFSDVLQTVHNVPGVDNVRFTKSTDDATFHGIKTCFSNGTIIATFDSDFVLKDNQLPIFNLSVLTRKSNNNF